MIYSHKHKFKFLLRLENNRLLKNTFLGLYSFLLIASIPVRFYAVSTYNYVGKWVQKLLWRTYIGFSPYLVVETVPKFAITINLGFKLLLFNRNTLSTSKWPSEPYFLKNTHVRISIGSKVMKTQNLWYLQIQYGQSQSE